MKRLCAGMAVMLELDGLRALPCVVTSVDEESASLVQTEQADAPVIKRLQGGATGFLVFAGRATPVGLRGRATMPPDQRPFIHFAGLDPASSTAT
jgi:hypothetical protein